jgi:WD40 repeat protein
VHDLPCPERLSVVTCATPEGQPRIVAGCNDEKIRIWDGDTFAVMHTMQAHPSYTYPVCAYTEPREGRARIISGGGDDVAKSWDVESGDMLHAIGGFKRTSQGMAVYACHFKAMEAFVSAEGNPRVIVVDGRGSVCIVDPEAGEVVQR